MNHVTIGCFHAVFPANIQYPVLLIGHVTLQTAGGAGELFYYESPRAYFLCLRLTPRGGGLGRLQVKGNDVLKWKCIEGKLLTDTSHTQDTRTHTHKTHAHTCTLHVLYYFPLQLFSRQTITNVYVCNWQLGISKINVQQHRGTGSASQIDLNISNVSISFTAYSESHRSALC